MSSHPRPPSSILIVGSGVFGLSTTLALSNRRAYSQSHLTLLDASPAPEGTLTLTPNPTASSTDTSRLIRADYSNRTYATLAAEAQRLWRGSDWGKDGRYSESGLVLVENGGEDGGGYGYVRESLENVRALARESGKGEGKIEELRSKGEIERVIGVDGVKGAGEWGYVNWGSGWADAEGGVRCAMRLVEKIQHEAKGRVDVRRGVEVQKLLYQDGEDGGRRKVTGVQLASGEKMEADLVVLCTGSWTGKLVDLRGRAEATGQALSYVDLSQEEQDRLEGMPACLNMSTGLFVTPPRDRLLKIGRHAFGYRNPVRIPHPEGKDGMIEVSAPDTSTVLPEEGQSDCRKALREMVPGIGDREFVRTRVCWYMDTPDGNFLIDYHPNYSGLFIATGDSGHGYKFFPVLGEKIVDAIEGRLDPALRKLWAWPVEAKKDFAGTEDGSRSGKKGMILREELKKS